MARYENKGVVIEINLAPFGHKGYFVEALYRFIEKEEKFRISLFTVAKDDNGDVTSLCPIAEPQMVECDKNEIKTTIVRLVRMMCDRKLINQYLILNTVYMEGDAE